MPPATAAQTSPSGKAPDYAGELARARRSELPAGGRKVPLWVAGESVTARTQKQAGGTIARIGAMLAIVDRPIGRAAEEQQAETAAERPDRLRNRRSQDTEGQRQAALLRKQGPSQRLREARVPGGGQLNGYMLLQGLRFAKMFTYWHTVYVMDVLYFMGANSKFFRQWIPPIGSIYDANVAATIVSGKPANPGIGPKLLEFMVLITQTIYVLALDVLIIAIIALVWYAWDWCNNNTVCGGTVDFIEAVAKAF